MAEAVMRLKAKDFKEVFQEQLSPWLKRKINELDFKYERLTRLEKKQYLSLVVKEIQKKKLDKSGRNRLAQWEKGWQENLDEGSIIPHYFGKYPVIRFKQDLIKPISPNFEYYSLAVITYWLLEKYFKQAKTVYEFGCGTGHNLLRVREINPRAELGDWTGLKVRKKLLKGWVLKQPDLIYLNRTKSLN